MARARADAGKGPRRIGPATFLVAEDDFVVLCRTPEEAQAALELIREWVSGASH